MAIIATVAADDSNSYLTVTEADTFAEEDLGRNAKKWRRATPEDKERALLRATAEVDDRVGFTVVYVSTQRLRFPRSVDLDTVGAPLLPWSLQRATYLQSAYLIANADLLDDASTRRARGLTNFSNPDGTGGSISEKRGFGRLHPDVEELIDGLSSGSLVGWIVTD